MHVAVKLIVCEEQCLCLLSWCWANRIYRSEPLPWNHRLRIL